MSISQVGLLPRDNHDQLPSHELLAARAAPRPEIRRTSRRMVSRRKSSSRDDSISLHLSSLELQPIEKSNPTKKLIERRLSGFTINKLKNNSSIGLIGREKETRTLKRSLHRMMEEHRSKAVCSSQVSTPTKKLVHSKIDKEIVFISGFSGVGKTSIAQSIEPAVKCTEHGLFVQGKFDLHKGKDQPYSAIAQGYGQILRHLKEQRAGETLGFARDLIKLAPNEIEALVNLIPELDEIVDVSLSEVSSDDSSNGRRGERWKYAFRVLTRLLTARIYPLVICIDDLQWSDDGSLALIEQLIDDIQNPNPLMVIGCYRSNEVDDTSRLSRMIRDLDESSATYGFNMTELRVSNCSLDDVSTIIMKMMSIDDEQSTVELAKLCIRRTQGNPYFLIEFMTMLYQEKLLTFNLGSMSWVYSVKEIEEATESTSNVVTLLHSRMRNLSADVQDLLRGAACLGPSFRPSTLHTVWTKVLKLEDPGDASEELHGMLVQAKEAMLIEACGDDRYRWVHDKVQEAALSLTEESHGKTFMFEIGKALYQNLSSKELEEELFDVVDLLNSASELKQREFAELNLRAAKKARQVSAFQAAAMYASKGIAMIPGDGWGNYRSLALELHILAAELVYVLGNVEATESYCKAVLARNDLTLDEVFPLRLLRINVLMSSNMRSNEHYLDLLKQMGFKFPLTGLDRLKEKAYGFLPSQSLVAHPVRILLKQTIKILGVKPRSFYSSLPMMTDEKCKKICDVLIRLCIAAYESEQHFLCDLCQCAVVKLTLEHGLCHASGYAFATLGGSALQIFQDYATSRHLCEMALFVQERVREGNAVSTQYIAHQYGLVWSLLFHQSRDAFYSMYLSGLSKGETFFSMWCLHSHLLPLPWMLGTPIDQILEGCSKLVIQLTQVSQNLILLNTMCFQQMLLNMSRRECPDRTRLHGDVFNRDKLLGNANSFVVQRVHLAECRLMLVYDRQALADQAVAHGSRYSKLILVSLMDETLHRGLALYSVARKTKNLSRKWKYAKRAKRIRKTVKKWVSSGNPNASEYAVMFDAEQAALDGKRKKAEENYQKAIMLAARTGNLHHAALYNELYAEFLWHGCNDLEEAKYRWEESIRFYEEWGALGKVDLLRATIRELNFPVVKGVVMEIS